MPRQNVNYEKTFFYKLCCKDPEITELYVGHTTNFSARKSNHKKACNEEDHQRHHLYVYQFINENGGWENWDMIELERISCQDFNEASKVEREWLERLGATLNKHIPNRNLKEYQLYRKTSGIRKEYDNRSERIEKRREYRELHAEEIKQKKKEYRERNIEAIKAYEKIHNAIKCVCERCGLEVTKKHLNRHHQSIQCKTAYENKQ